MHAATSTTFATTCVNQYSVAVVDDCLDDCALLEFLLRRSNIRLKTIRHYKTPADLLADGTFRPDVVLMNKQLTDCPISKAHVQDICVRYRNCSVLLHANSNSSMINTVPVPESAIAVMEKGGLDTYAIGAMVSAAALVGPSLRTQ